MDILYLYTQVVGRLEVQMSTFLKLAKLKAKVHEPNSSSLNNLLSLPPMHCEHV